MIARLHRREDSLCRYIFFLPKHPLSLFREQHTFLQICKTKQKGVSGVVNKKPAPIADVGKFRCDEDRIIYGPIWRCQSTINLRPFFHQHQQQRRGVGVVFFTPPGDPPPPPQQKCGRIASLAKIYSFFSAALCAVLSISAKIYASRGSQRRCVFVIRKKVALK